MTATYASQTDLINFMGLDSNTNPYSTTQLQDALNRAEIKINTETGTIFVDGTGATPSYTQVTEEKHSGKGVYNRDYYSEKYPLANVSTLLNGAVTADDTTITVDSTNGFPSSGSIFIGNDKIEYSGKDATKFTGCTSVSAHDDDSTVLPYGIEISTSSAGNVTTWIPLAEGTGFDVDLDSGRFHIYSDKYVSDPYGSNHPPKIPNRARLSYIAGNSTIPADIEWLCLAMASRDLMKAAVRKAHSHGKNSFNPDLLEVDSAEIDRLIKKNKSYKMSNV